VLSRASRGVRTISENLGRAPALRARLLIVDDEQLVREFLRDYLVLQGYTVDLSASSEEAWPLVQSVDYDCLLLDMNMPGMKGDELYTLIASIDQRLAQKVIFTTAGAVNPESYALLSATGNPILLKPFDLEELQQQILNLLESSNQPSSSRRFR